MVDRASLRAAAGLLLIGEILYVVVGLLHPAREHPNDHLAVFAEYADNATWTLVHMGQFLALALLLAGMVGVLWALDARTGRAAPIALFAGGLAIATLAMSAALQAVDGVALKQAVDAWVAAPEAEKAARFADAETVRWMEWSLRSYQRAMFGVTVGLVGAVAVLTGRIPRPIGALAIVSGIGYVAHGWLVGFDGFSETSGLPSLAALVTEVVWIVWLSVIAWRRPVRRA